MITMFGAIHTAKTEADSNEVARLPAVVVTPVDRITAGRPLPATEMD